MAQFKRGHYEVVAAIIKTLNDKADSLNSVRPGETASGYRMAVNDAMNEFVKHFKEETPSFDVFKFVAKAGRK